MSVDLTDVTNIPEGSILQVKELSKDETKEYLEKAAKAIDSDVDAISYSKMLDISILYKDEEIQPNGPVKVEITLQDKEQDIHPQVVHFGKKTEVLSASEDGNTVDFSTNSFSVFAILGTEIIVAPSGEFEFENDNYIVKISYTEEAKIPLGTELTVTEITPDDELYWELRSQTIEKINEGVRWENHDLPDPRKGLTSVAFFDITLNYQGNKIEPEVPLGVVIEYKNGGILTPQDEDTLVVHFAEDGTELIDDIKTEKEKVDTSDLPDSLKNSEAVKSFSYTQSSFSIVGTGSTGEYVEINDGNIDGGPGKLRAAKVTATRASSIVASKTVTDPDGDGVYELALNITGASESSSSTTVNKSNVVLVIDTSGSMNEYVYSPYTYSADTYNSSTTYYRGTGNNPGTVRYWPGGNSGYQYHASGWYYTTGYSNWNSYTGTVYTRQSRLDATKSAAVDLVDALLGNNKNETTPDGTNLNDIVEISLVTFAGASNNGTNGYLRTYDNTHFTGTSDSASATQLKNYINNLSAVGGTNWEAALKAAKISADTYSSQTGEKTAVIFLTDGKPTFYGSNDSGNGGEGDSNVQTSWNNARDDARTIVTSNYTLYNIFAFGTDTGTNSGSNFLKALTNYAYTGSGSYSNYGTTQYTRDYFFDARDTSALTDAFQAIIDSITDTVGYGGVEFDDGVTLGVTNTSVAIDGTVHDESFRYKVTNNAGNIVYSVKIADGKATFSIPGKGDHIDNSAETVITKIDENDESTWITSQVYSVEVDGVTYQMSPALINPTTGMVEWDLAGLGILENGYTYTVAFDVWPNQFSYDMVADLNNGIKTLEQIKQELIAEKGEEEGTALYNQIVAALVGPDANNQYAVRTNYEQKVDYYTIEEEEDSDGNITITYSEKQTKNIDFDESIELTSKPLPMVKIWNSNLSPDQIGNLLYEDYPTNQVPTEYRVTLHVWKADTQTELDSLISQYAGVPATASEHDYIEKTLGWDGTGYDWDDTVSIAPGTMVYLDTARDMGIPISDSNIVTYEGEQYYIIEKGHYYYVTEDNIDWHFELETVLYHPMMVNGRLKNVTFITDASGSITGVEDIEDMTQVAATNSKTAELDITKKIVDNTKKMTQDQMDTETFTYKVTLTVPKDADMSHTNALEWVARYNDDPSASNRYYVYGYQTSEDASLLGLDDDVERFNGKVYGQYTVSYPGGGATLDEIFTDDPGGTTKSGTIYITLLQNEIIRFTNLPAGTQYRIEEMYNNLYQANPSRDNDANLGDNAPESNIEENGYSVTVRTKNGEPTVSGRVVTGTIEALNKRYYNQFTNTLNDTAVINLAVKKHLDGYEWSGERYYVKLISENDAPLPRITTRYLSKESGSEDVSFDFGSVHLGVPGTYTYKLYETNENFSESVAGQLIDGIRYDTEKTITVTVADDMSITVDGAEWNSDTATATVTVTNALEKAEINVLKVDSKNNTKVLAGAEFELTVLKNNEYVPYPDSTTNKFTTGEDGKFTSDIKLASGTYRLTETKAPTDYVLPSDGTQIIGFTVVQDGQALKVTDVTNATLSQDGLLLTITNERKTTTLSVHKTVTGNMGNKTDTFTFKLELFSFADGTTPLTDSDWTTTNATYKNGYWEFTLGHDETKIFENLPVGTQYRVTEMKTESQSGYKTTYDGQTDPYKAKLGETGATEEVVNKMDSTVPTGIHTDSALWRWLIGACFLMFFGSVLYGRRKRRQ